MEKYISKSFRQFLALLLCAAMLMPIFPAPVSATGTTDSTVATEGTEAAQDEKTVHEETEPEWVLPECDCGSTEAELGKHGQTCALKVFLEKFCEETAAEIYSKWEKMPEECQKYVLEYLGQNADNAEKLSELNGYVDAAQAAETTEATTEATEATTEATEATTEATEATTEATEPATEEAKGLLGGFGLLANYPDIQVADGIVLPGYPVGVVSKTMEYDCGNGVTQDGSKSYLTVVTNTNSDEFTLYTQILAENGYTLKNEEIVKIDSDDSENPNLFASYTSPDGTYKLYTYHFPFYGETRIIVDTQEDTVKGFSYEKQSGETVKPILVMYGLSMATNGYDGQYSTSVYKEQRRNCGALVVIRMPDNSLFIHDGGDIQQWSDDACDEFLAFCRELTGTTGTNEKMVINTWFLSHAHSDHFLGFPRFINKYHDHFEMKNIMYNIDNERTDSTRDIKQYMELVSSYFEGVKYYKPHTGESFDIAGVQFDVMYALEDRYVPTESGDLITDTDDQGGTYRGYFYDTEDVMTSDSDFNDTCTVLRVTFPNGVNSIIYADMNRAEQTLFDIYPDDALKGNIVMVPHHGFDAHPELLAMSDATVFLYTQHKQAIYGPDGDYTTQEDESVVRARLYKNFIAMKEALDAKENYEEGTHYKFYWAGCETAAIDINSMSGLALLAETESEDFGMTQDTSAPNGITVYTAEANDDLYTNAWTVYDLNDGTATVSTSTENQLGTSGSATVEDVATGTTRHIRFDPVTTLTVNKRYLIRSAAYDQYIMSYAAVAKNPGYVNKPTSLVKNTSPGSTTDTMVFFPGSGSNSKYVYMDHSNRDNALWILLQDGTDNGTNLATSSYSVAFGGSALYGSIRLAKGTKNNGVYWYSIKGNDETTPITQYRFLNPRYVNSLAWLQNVPINEETTTKVSIKRFVIEKFSDGTFLIYFRNESATDVRILNCDANGNWRISRYTDATGDAYPAVSEATANLANLKVKLYVYNFPSETNTKTINFSGSTTFNVEQGTTYEQVLNYIQQNIAVRDTDRRNMAIPGSGGTAKVGYYWLDMTETTFDSSKAGTYNFTVKYRNDDGSDTTIPGVTLKVNVADINVTGTTTYTVMEGTSQADIEEMIRDAITVTQTAGGTKVKDLTYTSTPTVGAYYWLDFNTLYDLKASGTDIYTVTVKYRNPDGTDAASATTLTVIVKPRVFECTGTKTYVVEQGTTETAVRQMIANVTGGITVKEKTEGKTLTYSATPTVGDYYWMEFDSEFKSGAGDDHDYFVNVYYRNADGTDTLIDTLAVYVQQEFTYNKDISAKVGTVPLNSGVTTVTKYVDEENETSGNITFTVTANGEKLTRYVTVGMLTDSEGNPIDTSVMDEGKTEMTYTGLTVTYMGEKICTDFTLIVTASDDVLNYPQEGQGGHVGVNKESTTNPDDFKDTGVANIELSATGTPPERGIDLIVVMDLSGSMLNEIGTNVDAEDYQKSRTVAMEKALKDMIKMMAESGADVTIAMTDFGDLDHNQFEGSVVDTSILHEAVFDANNDNGRYLSSTNENKKWEFTNHLNYVFKSSEALNPTSATNKLHQSRIGTFSNVHTKFNQAHPQYTGWIPPTVYTGTGEVEAGAFMDVGLLYSTEDGGFTKAMDDIIAEIDVHAHDALGTNYDIGLEYAYHLGYAKQQDNIANGVGTEREVICIFMSDGAAMQYNYFSGRSNSPDSWTDFLLGNITNDSIASAGYTADKMPTELHTISARLLTALQNGDLYRPESNRDNPKPVLYDAVDGNALNNGKGYQEEEYFLYRIRSAGDFEADTFYAYMEKLGFDLDWEYLCAIARANGFEDFDFEYYTNPNNGQGGTRMTKLIEKLLVKDTLLGYEKVETTDADGKVTTAWYKVYQTDLVNPGLDETTYYPKFTGTPTGNNATEQFLNAMASVGVDCSWDLYAKIALKNRSKVITKATATTEAYIVQHALEDLVTALKSAGNDSYVTYSPYSYFYNKDGKNWWAEAIKGDTDKLYPVINKYASDSTIGTFHKYNGDVPNNFSGETTTGLALKGQDYVSGFRGLGMDMYTISFSICDDFDLTAEVAEHVLLNIATGPSYFYAADSADSLTNALKSITGSMSTAATRAWFTDTLGANYDLYVGQPNTTYATGAMADKTTDAISQIRVLEYTLKDGERTDDYIVRETITIKDVDGDGDVDAISDQMYNTVVDSDGNITREYYNIWDETTNLITGKHVIYNAGTSEQAIAFGGQGTYKLAGETFFWTIGVIGETEMVLEYPVYLTGSKEGTLIVPAGKVGVYDTNLKADLHYVNYLGNNSEQPTVTPSFPWGKPAVGYAFYLVDENGNPLDAYGRTTSFANSLKLTNVTYEYLNTLDDGTTNTTTIKASDKLPADLADIYDLFNTAASYTVVYDESWQNNGGNTTYVTDFGGTAPSNAANSGAALSGKANLEKTVVYFALKEHTINPDVVVIDYGLPVVVDVLANDGLAGNPALLGIAKGALTNPASGSYSTSNVTGNFGTASVTDNKIKYVLNSKDMMMKAEEVYTYKVQNISKTRTYYSTLTVIPATSIYYEDSYLTFNVYDFETDVDVTSSKDSKYANNKWAATSSATTSNQAQDRPGNLTAQDANNIYGYDSAYQNMLTYSMGSAMKVTVDSDAYATAKFDFWGTGFDIISVTSGDTGVIKATVYDSNGVKVKSMMVDTYYGYSYGDSDGDGDKEWYVNTSSTNALYQVPVLKMQLSEYGQYTAVITVSYADFLDNRKDGAYDFYLDAIRIYDPANDGADSPDIKDAYTDDNEGWPEYFELRNLIIRKNDFDILNDSTTDEVNGIVFIDGIPALTDSNASKVEAVDGKTPAISDYTNFGPNNELYLAKGQAVAFKLNIPKDTDNDGKNDLAKIHLALKTVGGKAAGVTVYNAADTNKANVISTSSVNTATDLYYDITALNGKTVVIKNTGTGDGILSITNIKVTHTLEHEDSTDNYLTVSTAIAEVAMMSLRPRQTEDPTEPEATEPEATEPEATEPEATEPEATEPEVTEPEATEPETTEPEATKPAKPGSTKPSKPGSTKPTKPNTTEPTKPATTETEPTEPETTEPEATEPAATEPEVTEPAGEPEATEPEATEPEATEPETTEQEAFKPRRFKVKLPYDSVKVGSYVVIKITTKRDVDKITINGQEVTQYKENHWTANRKWVVKVKMSTVGQQTIDMVAWNANGVASETVEQTVTVTERYTSIRNWIEDLVSGMFTGRRNEG